MRGKLTSGFFEALGGGRLAEAADMLDEDVVFEFPGTRFGGLVEGRRRVLVFLRQNQRLFRGGLRFTLHWVGAAGERTVAQWTNAGITRDGRPYSNRGITVFHWRGEKVFRIEDYLDTERIRETWPS